MYHIMLKTHKKIYTLKLKHPPLSGSIIKVNRLFGDIYLKILSVYISGNHIIANAVRVNNWKLCKFAIITLLLLGLITTMLLYWLFKY